MIEANQYSLSTIDGKLSLICDDDKNFKPFFIDFTAGKSHHRRVFRGKELVVKAVGFKAENPPTIIDATAGLGRDAFVLASVGCEVTLIERSPILHALLADALERAMKAPELESIVARMHLLEGDAAKVWPSLSADCVYLDPMYPHRTKSALVKKELRILRDLVGDDPDADSLWEFAMNSASKRIVVKRPRLGNVLAEKKPNFSYNGKSSRFDIYIR